MKIKCKICKRRNARMKHYSGLMVKGEKQQIRYTYLCYKCCDKLDDRRTLQANNKGLKISDLRFHRGVKTHDKSS